MMKLVIIATVVAFAALPACEQKDQDSANEAANTEKTAPLLPEATNVEVDEGSADSDKPSAAGDEEAAGADKPSAAEEEETAPAPSEDEGSEGEDYE